MNLNIIILPSQTNLNDQHPFDCQTQLVNQLLGARGVATAVARVQLQRQLLLWLHTQCKE